MPRRKNDFYPTLDTNAIGYLMKNWDLRSLGSLGIKLGLSKKSSLPVDIF